MRRCNPLVVVVSAARNAEKSDELGHLASEARLRRLQSTKARRKPKTLDNGLAWLAHEEGFFASSLENPSFRRWQKGKARSVGLPRCKTGRTTRHLGHFLRRLPTYLCSVSQMGASVFLECASRGEISTVDVALVCLPLQTSAPRVPA